MATFKVNEISYVPFEMYITELALVKNIIIARAVAWDLCSYTLTILFSIGTSKVPPPDPNIPLTKPVKIPIIEFK